MAQGDLDKVRANIENWYNGTMDRVSGWYRRRTQTILFLIGLGAAAALNVDAITIAKRLNNDKALRQAAVAQAGAVVRGQGANSQGANAGQGANGQGVPKTPIESLQERTYTQLRTNLDEIGFPVGWYVKGSPWKDWSNFRLVPAPQACGRPGADQNGRPAATAPDECKNFRPPGLTEWIEIGLGWLVTALAIMLGAPFWFDVLNKFVVVRSTVKPHEKSPEEASEDRQERLAAPQREAGAG